MFTYKKVGGLHFFKVGRFGLTFYVAKRQPSAKAQAFARQVEADVERARYLDRLQREMIASERAFLASL